MGEELWPLGSQHGSHLPPLPPTPVLCTSSSPALPWARVPGSPASAPQAKPSAGQVPWPLSLRGHGILSPVWSLSGPPRSSELCRAPLRLSLCPSLAAPSSQRQRAPGSSRERRKDPGGHLHPGRAGRAPFSANGPLCVLGAVHSQTHRVTEDNDCAEAQRLVPAVSPSGTGPPPPPPLHSPGSRRQPWTPTGRATPSHRPRGSSGRAWSPPQVEAICLLRSQTRCLHLPHRHHPSSVTP